MYTFTNKLRNFSIILMVVGFFGLTYGFLTSPKTVEEATAMVDAPHHGDGHGHNDVHSKTTNNDDADSMKSYPLLEEVHRTMVEITTVNICFTNYKINHGRPLCFGIFFFMMIALGTLAFYAINRAAQAGGHLSLFRVMEGITAYLLPGAIIVFVILMLSGMHFNHLFIWMDPEVVAHDKLIQGKTGFLNTPFFLARAFIYIAGWVTYRYFSRKFSLAQDQASDMSNHKKNFRISAGFLVFYIVTESMMSWDWIMSIDPSLVQYSIRMVCFC